MNAPAKPTPEAARLAKAEAERIELQKSFDALRKSHEEMRKANEDMQQRLAKAEAVEAHRVAVGVAKAMLGTVPGDPEKLASVVKLLDTPTHAEAFEALKQSFAAANEIAKSSKLFEPSGSNSTKVTKAEDALDAKAKEIAKSDGVSYAVAYARALERNPHLYTEHLAEQDRAAKLTSEG